MKLQIMVGFMIKTIVNFFEKLEKKMSLLPMRKATIPIKKYQTVDVRLQKIGGLLKVLNGK